MRHIRIAGIPCPAAAAHGLLNVLWRLDKKLSSQGYAAKHQLHSLLTAEALSRTSQDGKFSAFLRSMQHFRLFYRTGVSINNNIL